MKTTLNRQSVIGVFRQRSAADECFLDLIRRGYLSSDVNLIMTDQTRTRDYPWSHEDEVLAKCEDTTMGSEGGGIAVATKAERSAGTMAGSMATQGVGVGGSIGTAVGATLAAIAAVGTSIVIPGLNVIVAGPIVATLAGAGAGAVAGGMVGGLIGLGIPEPVSKAYNHALNEGGVVISVFARPEDVEEIQNLMILNSGEQISSCAC